MGAPAITSEVRVRVTIELEINGMITKHKIEAAFGIVFKYYGR